VTPGRPGSSGPARARCGVTIAELVVVLVLIGVIGSTIGLSLVRQQRFYRSATELLRAREGVRDAMELLASDVRGMSVADTARLLADSAIEFFANVGSSVVCDYAGGTAVGLPGLSPRQANALTSFVTQPDTGDLAFFHRDSSDGVSEWEGHRIAGFAARPLSTTCPDASRFGRHADAGADGTGFLLDLFSPPSSRAGTGAPVRFIRRSRYSTSMGQGLDLRPAPHRWRSQESTSRPDRKAASGSASRDGPASHPIQRRSPSPSGTGRRDGCYIRKVDLL